MNHSELVKTFIQHRDVLFAFLLALTRDADAAEEVFQDLGVSILNESARGTRPEHFLAWARTLARHRVADYYRRHARQLEHRAQLERLGDVVVQAFDENPVAAEETHQRLTALRACLGRLATRARQIVDARYRDQRSLADIAAATGWQPASIKVALAKARKALAECVSRRLRMQEGAP